MRRTAFAALWLMCLAALLGSTGCGPGLVALSGGSAGAWFGLSGDDDDKKDPAPPVAGPNVAPAVIVTALVREESPARIQYTLIDANAENCSIQVEYSVSGSPFAACLPGTGGDGSTGLASSAGGTNHEFRWDFQTDLGPQRTTDIDVRIRANDGTQFGSWFTLPNQTIGNDGPVISNVSLLGNSGVLLMTFDLADQNSDLASFGIEWSIDSGLNFTAVDAGAEIVGNPPVGLLTSPGGSPGQIVWNSSAALSNYVGDIYLRFTVHDQPAGYATPTPSAPVVEGPFALDNAVNQPPVLELARAYAGQQYVSKVPLDFTLADGESDAAAVFVAYSVRGGAAQTATLTQQFGAGTAGPFPTTPSPTFYSVYWDALADLQADPDILTTGVPVNVILVPLDSQAGTPVITAQFTVLGNSAPEVDSITPLNSFGNVPVVVRLTDESSDPVSLDVSYSTDGTNFTPLTQADFAFGSLSAATASPTGEDNLLVWDTSLVFSGATANQPTVYLRVTPTDHPPSATPSADLAGQAFTSGAFAIINNPAGATPVSIDLYTVAAAGGTSPTTPQLSTVLPGGTPPADRRHFNRTINPASAVGYETFFAIVQGPGHGTLLDDLGNPLDYATGSLTLAAPGVISTGDTITIGDGFNTPIVFEFYNGGPMTFPNPNTLVDISTTATASGVAAALHAALQASLGGSFLLQSSRVAETITLTHYIACNQGNWTGAGGAAPALAFSNPAVVTASSNLSGGASPTNGVTFVAPATAPSGSEFVTLLCQIDDPLFSSVKDFHTLYWGSVPTSVSISPSAPQVMLNGTQPLSATVLPAGAPQRVDWEVVGGSQNGTITAGGEYRAPGAIPAQNPVTVRAYSVQAGVFGTVQITLVPEPASIDVTSQGGATSLVLSGGTSSTLQFFATVNPSGAPSGVAWRLSHNNTDHGTGNSTVGTISAGGLYTAPNALISPPVVQIQAVSLVKPAVYGSFNLTLTAPAPTSFQLSPSSVTLYAGGAGQQFTPVNFVPSNANPAVSWELIPATGFGTVSSSGYYTPPATVATATNVTVRARSSVQSTVLADAVVDLRPNQATTPTSVLVSPDEGITTCAGPHVQFSASVLPGSASQAVVWTIVGTPIGSVDAAGKYQPANSTTDYTETIRATAVGFPAVFDDAIVRVTGSGHTPTDKADVIIGRSDASAVWDATNQRLWWIGGASEVTNPDHDIQTLYYDVGADSFQPGPTISGAGGGFTSPPRSVQAALDTNLGRIWAICGMGAAQAPRVFYLALAAPTGWTEVVSPGGGGSDIPFMANSGKHPFWYDSVGQYLGLMQGNNEVFRFQPSTTSWIGKVSISQTSSGPAVPLNNAFVWRQSSREGIFIGPENAASGAATRVHVLEMANTRWVLKTSSGQVPSVGLAEAGLFLSNVTGTYWLFGGRQVATANYFNDMHEIAISGSTATWSLTASAGSKPSARTRMALSNTVSGTGPVFYGGRNSQGNFGDIWLFDEGTKVFSRAAPGGLLPQGRRFACGGFMDGQGFIYGGSCDHGASNELWSVSFAAGQPQWSLRNPGGTAPPGLVDAAVAIDPGNKVMFMFGGSTSPFSKTLGATAGLYAYNAQTNNWALLSPSGTPPSARYGASMCAAFNAGGGIRELWLFGGESGAGKLNDLYKLDLTGGLPGTWALVAPGNSPPDAREGAALGWDSRRNRLLLAGGNSSVSGPNRQFFEYDIATTMWQSRTITNVGSDESVYASCAAYDDQFRRFIHAPGGKPKFQAIVVSTTSPGWQYLVAPLADHATGGVGLFDPATGRYWAVTGERTVATRTIGTNHVRTFRVK